MADVMTGGEVGPWWRWRPPASRVLPEMSRGQERGGQRASEAFYSEGVHYSWWWVVWVVLAGDQVPAGVCPRAGNEPSPRLTYTIMDKAPTSASWLLKAPTIDFTLKTLLDTMLNGS